MGNGQWAIGNREDGEERDTCRDVQVLENRHHPLSLDERTNLSV